MFHICMVYFITCTVSAMRFYTTSLHSKTFWKGYTKVLKSKPIYSVHFSNTLFIPQVAIPPYRLIKNKIKKMHIKFKQG